MSAKHATVDESMASVTAAARIATVTATEMKVDAAGVVELASSAVASVAPSVATTVVALLTVPEAT